MTEASMFKNTAANPYQNCWGCFLYLNLDKCLDPRHMHSVPANPCISNGAHLCRPMAALRHQARFLIEHRCPRGADKNCAKKKLTGHAIRTIEPIHVCVTCWVKHVLKGKKA
jgi:hypothetical protein